MTLTVNQYFAIIVNLCFFIGFLFALKFNAKRNTERVDKVEKAVFKKDGGLNVVNNETCSERMKSADSACVSRSDALTARQDRDAAIVIRAFENIDCLNQNMFKLLMYHKIEPAVAERGSDDKLNR